MSVKAYILGSVVVLALQVKAQDMQFSQFYASPLYINPAFTGATIQHRLNLNYRHQWPAIPGAFESYHFSYDYNADAINSGFGLIFNKEEAGSFGLTSTIVATSYAYRFRLNRRTYLQPGLKLGLGFRGIDYSKLVFNDQLENNNDLTADEDAFRNETNSYADISTGLLLYGESYWFGSSVNHLNQPNQTLLEEGNESILPMKISLHGGYRIQLSGPVVKRLNAKEILAALHYKSQGLYDQIDLGAYYSHNPFVFGLWYRGIPGFKAYDAGYANNDALIFLVGYSIPDRNFRIGYSYDVTISRLAANSGGAHEISIIYEAASRRTKRRNRRFLVPCAKF
jgi:type IX secretion system PorP/SprF family membrane protein